MLRRANCLAGFKVCDRYVKLAVLNQIKRILDKLVVVVALKGFLLLFLCLHRKGYLSVLNHNLLWCHELELAVAHKGLQEVSVISLGMVHSL